MCEWPLNTGLTAFAISSTSIYIEWQGLNMEDLNGELLGYHIYYNNGLVTHNITTSNVQNKEITGLYSSTTFVIDVCAYNSAEEGPCETTDVTTLPSGMDSFF